MAATYKIAEVARRSGFTASTLRYYEERGLVPPADRTPAGYRLYDDSSLARLAFIDRAKQLGCTLEEITDLLTAWEGDQCEPVQSRLRHLVDAKIGESQTRLAELTAFTAQLQQAAAALTGHTPDGPCDDDCGCSRVLLVAPPTDEPIACTLDADDMPERLRAWRVTLSRVTGRAPIENGVRLTFPSDVPLGELVELAAAEQDCCRFFAFAITVDSRGVAFEVTAPEDARDLVHSLFGAPA